MTFAPTTCRSTAIIRAGAQNAPDARTHRLRASGRRHFLRGRAAGASRRLVFKVSTLIASMTAQTLAVSKQHVLLILY